MTVILIAVVLYLLAAGLLVRSVAGDAGEPSRPWLWPALGAVTLHAAYHLLVAWRTPGGPDMHFFAALSLVSLGMAAMTLLVAIQGRMAALGVVAFPLAAALLAAYHLYGHRASSGLGWRLQLHAWLALLAYAALAIAALLAVMLWAQERALRRREFHLWLRALPPLTELEDLLFRTITVGFILLTATLLTGVLFVENFLVQKLTHKTVLSVLSWLVFGGLLMGRWRYGWRGAKAVHWTLTAMALLLLAFFGSKFVYEMVLRRGLSTRLGDRILKVDHAGEHGAANIYRAQILVARWTAPHMTPVIRHFLEHELGHRALFWGQLQARGVRRCHSYVLCGVGGWTLGLVTGLLGASAIAATTYAVESVVLQHLLEQRRQLETADPDAFDTVSRIIAEEQEHHDHGRDAMQAGAFWPPILTPVVRASTEAVIWLGMRL